MRISPFAWALPGLFFCLNCTAQVLTSQYDNQRTGATLGEKTLTPQNVNPGQFGKLGTFKVDGAVYAQPLYLPSVEIPGKGKHNVLFVATEHDSVYAFDAERPEDPPLWQISLLDKQKDESPVPARSVQCPFIQPEIGITPTPVIDLPSGTLYVLARTMAGHAFSGNQYFQRLHALAITTGAEKLGGPKPIDASVPGRGAGSSGGQVRFDPLRENPRASLLLLNGSVFVTWASSCDVAPYHGWAMAYDARTLAQQAVLNVTPDGEQGGIWASDTGPAADSSGNIYMATGNGTFDASSGGRDYGDTVLKLALRGGELAIQDYFTPYDQATLNRRDADVGSSGPLALPDQPGTHRHVLLQPSKGGALFVLDRDQMGQFHPDGDAVIERLQIGESYGAMAYWNGHIFFAASDDNLRDYTLAKGQLVLHKSSSMRFENPGATPSVSADGTQNAVVWVITTKVWNGADNRAAVLYAFDARDLTRPIYSSEQNSQRDRAGLATRFVFPVVVNGRVYFAARGEVELYGLLK